MQLSNIKFRNYKSFGDYWSTIQNVSGVNVLIGRNNSGKSSVLDVIEGLTDANIFHRNSILVTSFSVKMEHMLTEQEIRELLKECDAGSVSWCIEKFEGKVKNYFVDAVWEHFSNQNIFEFKYLEHIEQSECFDFSIADLNLKNSMINPYQLYKFRKLAADRDIVPEGDSATLSLAENGEGATRIIKTFLLDNKYDEKIVENTLLSALNDILASDASYERIRIQSISDGENGERWEIFLEEKGKRYPLSKMGSGLKTILLVLINLLVIPEMEEYKTSRLIFAFEELENNLHPALQRRLFEYLYQYSINKETILFLTTHSHVAINLFANRENVQLFHVKKENGYSTVETVDDYISKSQILEDLDVKASDLLQSNGIIWVEGPSDRIYIKKWIELYAEKSFIEGRDYQFLYYGGRLLSHYTSNEEQTKLLNILTTNRHAAIVIDSDKRRKSSVINDTKRRIRDEFKEKSLFCWITQGKEIENYIKAENLSEAFKKEMKQCGQFELFPDYIEPVYKNFKSKKVEFAREITETMVSEKDVDGILDLKNQVKKLVDCINKWNS